MTTYKNNLISNVLIEYTVRDYFGFLNLEHRDVLQSHTIHPNEIFKFDETENNGTAINTLCVQAGLTLT